MVPCDFANLGCKECVERRGMKAHHAAFAHEHMALMASKINSQSETVAVLSDKVSRQAKEIAELKARNMVCVEWSTTKGHVFHELDDGAILIKSETIHVYGGEMHLEIYYAEDEGEDGELNLSLETTGLPDHTLERISYEILVANRGPPFVSATQVLCYGEDDDEDEEEGALDDSMSFGAINENGWLKLGPAAELRERLRGLSDGDSIVMRCKSFWRLPAGCSATDRWRHVRNEDDGAEERYDQLRSRVEDLEDGSHKRQRRR